VMIDVRNDVLKATDGKQVPWENSSLTGQFFFKPKAPPTVADQTADAAAQITALRQEIERLQADQGARLTAQQEQLEILQHKLASETKTADQLAAAQGNGGTPNAVNRVIAVEPASDAKPQPDVAGADTKIAAADTGGTEAKAPGAAPAAPAPLPEGVTQAELAEDIVSQLKDLDCYQGRVNRSWGRPAQDALERFNTLAKLDLPVDEPEQATLDALKEWKGPHCTIQVAVPRKEKAPKYQAAKPPATYRKSATPRRYHPQAAARAAPPRPAHNDGVGDEQRELQRLFPQTRWPGQQ
jgi:hypothetical protein